MNNVLSLYIQKTNTMAQGALSMRIDEGLKKSFDAICDDFGLTSSAAITLFIKTVVRERRIPFEIKATPTKEQINAQVWDAFLMARERAASAGATDMTLEEINEEIRSTRNDVDGKPAF